MDITRYVWAGMTSLRHYRMYIVELNEKIARCYNDLKRLRDCSPTDLRVSNNHFHIKDIKRVIVITINQANRVADQLARYEAMFPGIQLKAKLTYG